MRPPLRLASSAGPERTAEQELDTAELLELEAIYCSHGDTVHYTEPKIFERCEGSLSVRRRGPPYLDLQMWYSAVNFGYANRRLERRAQAPARPAAAGRQPVPAPREDRACGDDRARRGGQVRAQGPRPLQRRRHPGGRGLLKLVRNAKNGKSLMFAFEGGYHGRTLGASAITSSYRYRRRYGHFGDRAQFVPFPYHFRGPKGMSKEEYGLHCVQQFERLFESEYNGVWDPQGRPGGVRRLLRRADPGHRRLRHSAARTSSRAEEGARPARHPAGRRRNPDGLLPHRQAVVDRALRRHARHHRVRQGAHQRPQSAVRASGRARS